MSPDYTLMINIVQITLLLVLGLAAFYLLIFATGGLFYRQPPYPAVTKHRKIAVLIPGYKEDEVILEVAKDALRQEYPAAFFDVVVIADSFHPETLKKLKELPLKLIEVSFDKSTKAKALNRAMEQLADIYEIAVVLDADNIMEPKFLSKINSVFEHDIYAVQGHRTAKNMNTPMAILDAASEEINNHIFRKGHRAVGLSSAIIGSGMAFKYGFFKEIMATVTAIGGFDKEIEMKLLRDGYKIEYLADAYVYDEKVQKADVFVNQRRRWLAAQVKYFRLHFISSLKDLFLKQNIDYFDKVFQSLQPPRILLLGSVMLFSLVFIIVNMLMKSYLPFIYLWLVLLLSTLLVFIFSVPRSFYRISTLKALASLPGGMILMLASLLSIKGADKQFIHTKHTSTGKAR
jgi:cellulose synthase/poly-beta-1,6-N-acetylglucosamine synthase-like glycosyltransferase